VSGDVEAAVPSGLGYTVALSTLSGDIENALELADQQRSNRSRKGRYGDGAVPLSITTVSGEIELERT
jgi:DUF4097 and DUF4098 domain-containing protein YvlB